MPSAFAKKFAAIAVDQYDTFHEFSENDSPLSAQIKKYWQSIGLKFPGVKTAWSAVFVSFCVKSAGATAKEFTFAAAHAKFVRNAIQNALHEEGVFRGFPIDKYAPQVGDIIQNNRSGNKFSYDFAKTHSAYESHSAIVVEVGVNHQGSLRNDDRWKRERFYSSKTHPTQLERFYSPAKGCSLHLRHSGSQIASEARSQRYIPKADRPDC